MKIEKLDNMTRGWFIGDFEPSVLRTKDFEAGIAHHKKGELWPAHYHAIATEYNVLVSGKVSICNEIIEPGTVFVIDPMEVADPVFLEDSTIVVIKVPAVSGDKYKV